MFVPETWAAAFINSIEKENLKLEDGKNILAALASWSSARPEAIYGRVAAEKLEPLIRKAISSYPAGETTLRFFLLMVKRNTLRYVNLILAEIKKSLDRKNGIVTASLEYAVKLDEEFESLIVQTIKKRNGAKAVELTGRLRPELIGGFRLKIGDELIDATILSQLRKMKSCLSDGGSQWQVTET